MFPRWKLDYLWFNFHFVQKLKSIETVCRGVTNHKEKTDWWKKSCACMFSRNSLSSREWSSGMRHMACGEWKLFCERFRWYRPGGKFFSLIFWWKKDQSYDKLLWVSRGKVASKNCINLCSLNKLVHSCFNKNTSGDRRVFENSLFFTSPTYNQLALFHLN